MAARCIGVRDAAHHVSARASQRSGTVDRVGDVWRSRRDSYRSRAFIPWAWGRAATAVLGEHADWRAVAYHFGASPVAVGASGYGYPYWTVLAINFLGDGLRDALDPRMSLV